MKRQKLSLRCLRFPEYVELGHFTMLFCRGRLRNVQRFTTHVFSHCSVAPYSFLTARELSNSTPKSHAESCSKMPTNMASKFLQFVYRKCCVDRLRFQNIYRLNRRPYLLLLGLTNPFKLICSIATIIERGRFKAR